MKKLHSHADLIRVYRTVRPGTSGDGFTKILTKILTNAGFAPLRTIIGPSGRKSREWGHDAHAWVSDRVAKYKAKQEQFAVEAEPTPEPTPVVVPRVVTGSIGPIDFSKLNFDAFTTAAKPDDLTEVKVQLYALQAVVEEVKVLVKTLVEELGGLSVVEGK